MRHRPDAALTSADGHGGKEAWSAGTIKCSHLCCRPERGRVTVCSGGCSGAGIQGSSTTMETCCPSRSVVNVSDIVMISKIGGIPLRQDFWREISIAKM